MCVSIWFGGDMFEAFWLCAKATCNRRVSLSFQWTLPNLFFFTVGLLFKLTYLGHVTHVGSHDFMVSMYQTAIIGGGLISYPVMKCQGKIAPVHAGSLALPLVERQLKSKRQSILPGSLSLFFSFSLCCHYRQTQWHELWGKLPTSPPTLFSHAL